jgi:hypothetical protein
MQPTGAPSQSLPVLRVRRRPQWLRVIKTFKFESCQWLDQIVGSKLTIQVVNLSNSVPPAAAGGAAAASDHHLLLSELEMANFDLDSIFGKSQKRNHYLHYRSQFSIQ